jgi:hypothetical protein
MSVNRYVVTADDTFTPKPPLASDRFLLYDSGAAGTSVGAV